MKGKPRNRPISEGENPPQRNDRKFITDVMQETKELGARIAQVANETTTRNSKNSVDEFIRGFDLEKNSCS